MAYCPKEKMFEKKEPNRDPPEDRPVETEEDIYDSDSLNINEEEINSLNTQLDQLNSALDKLEQKNDDLHAQLVELLEVNKQAREHFLQIREQNVFDCSILTEKIDYDYYLFWALAPLVITLLLPATLVLMLYLDALILYVYTLHWGNIINAYENGFHNGALKTVAAIWEGHAKIWHGYEVVGLENIPDTEGALIIYYHGAIPIDLYYLMSHTFLRKNRLVYSVADRFLFKIPGFSILAENMKIIPGTVQECSNILKANNLLAISPGGVFEAQFGDSNYNLLWRNRLGFAKVALEAKKPIIPIFTQNVREAFISVAIGRKFWLKLYTWTKLPFVPILGGFPVKLRTYIGKPILYESITPEQLKAKVADSLNKLIREHQRIPGSITRALIDRFYCPKPKAT